MNKNLLLLGLLSCGLSSSALAEETATTNKGTESTVKSESKDDDGKVEKLANALSRFSIDIHMIVGAIPCGKRRPGKRPYFYGCRHR